MGPHTEKIVNELCNYLGYDLSGPMCKELHEHIQECEECRSYIESIKSTVHICKEAHQSVSVPNDLKQDLLRKLKNKMSK